MGVDTINFEEIRLIGNIENTDDGTYRSSVNNESMVNSRIEEMIECVKDLAEADLGLVDRFEGSLIQLVGQPEKYMTENGTILTTIEGVQILLISSNDVSNMSIRELNTYCKTMGVDFIVFDKNKLKNTIKGVYLYDSSKGRKVSGYGTDFKENNYEGSKDFQTDNLSVAYDNLLQRANGMILNKRSDIKRDGSMSIKKNIYHGDNGYTNPIKS